MKMVRSLIIGAMALAVAGCGVTVNGGKVQTTDPKVQQVIDGVGTLCSFYPLASTVLALFKKSPGTTIEGFKNLICNAVDNAVLADGPPPRVKGVVIHGTFTNGRQL